MMDNGLVLNSPHYSCCGGLTSNKCTCRPAPRGACSLQDGCGVFPHDTNLNGGTDMYDDQEDAALSPTYNIDWKAEQLRQRREARGAAPVLNVYDHYETPDPDASRNREKLAGGQDDEDEALSPPVMNWKEMQRLQREEDRGRSGR